MKVVIIGGGISGLSSAFRIQEAARAAGKALSLTVLEAGDTPGGTARTAVEDGWVVEGGPNGFLDSKPATMKLVADLALSDRLLPADHASKIRFLFVDGKLKALPTSPPAFMTSSVLPLWGRLRILLEPLQPKGPADESLGAFGRRRLGRHAVERLLDPFVSGIHAGDVEKLSVAAAFPAVKQLEQEYGGLIKGMRAKAKARKADPSQGPSAGGAAGPGGHLHSFDAGMRTLIEALAAALDGTVRTGAKVASVAPRTGGGFVVTLADGEALEADAVVSAAPAHAAGAFMADLDDDLARGLAALPYAPAHVVAVGLKRDQVAHPLDGFGFIVPSRERRDVLGVLWTSSIYPGHRAPEGHVLLRTILGGARRPDIAALPDEGLIEVVQKEHAATMGLTWKDPAHLRIFRWDRAIPQYLVGHRDRTDAIEAAAARHPGLFLTGNWLHGIGVNDCTADAERVGRDFEAWLGQTPAG